MGMVLGLGTARWRHAALDSSPGMRIPALALFFVGFSIYFQAGEKISANHWGLPEGDAGSERATSDHLGHLGSSPPSRVSRTSL
jgi:hypothetical protein